MSKPNELNEQTEFLTLSEAAERVKTSRSRLWRAKEAGQLSVTKQRINGRRVWCVTGNNLEKWCSSWLAEEEMTELNELNGTSEQTEQTEKNTLNTLNERTEQSEAQNPLTGEAMAILLNHLEEANRRAWHAENRLSEHQRLLTTTTETQQEAEARAREAEAKAKQLTEELASLKTELSNREETWAKARRPWWQRMLGQQSG